MPAAVDRKIEALMRRGMTKAQAIRVLKANGTIKQKGKHLVLARKGKKK